MQENAPDFEKHIDDIVKAIGDKLERNVIANELRRYVDEYGIDLATAKESIVRKHYGNPNELSVGGGFWTPASAMGDSLIKRLPDAGVTFKIL